MQDHNDCVNSFAGSQLQLPRRPLHRPSPSLQAISNILDANDSPHVHVTDTSGPCTPVSQSELSMYSISGDSPIEGMNRPPPLTPDMRQTSSFDDWRMPAFSSLAAIPDNLRDDELRDIQSARAAPHSYDRCPRLRDGRNTLTLGERPREGFRPHNPASPRKGCHRRGKNRALGTTQFDDLLTEVFIHDRFCI